MRILERCAPLLPLPEMQTQVNALREAFSADLTKPFELRKGFGTVRKSAGGRDAPGDGRQNHARTTKPRPVGNANPSSGNSLGPTRSAEAKAGGANTQLSPSYSM